MKLFYGTCEKCGNELIEGKAVITQSSKIFKGTNKYLVCDKCGAVSLYNESLNSMFNIDKYKNNEAILDELSELLQDLNMEIANKEEEVLDNYLEEDDILYNNDEVLEENEHQCSGSCSTCESCSGDCGHHEHEEEAFDHEKYIFAYNKQTEEVSLLAIADLSILGDVHQFDFFVLEPVTIKPVTTYEIIK